MVLVDYEDGIITTTLDHSLGRWMIDVGQATVAGDKIHKMIQRLTSLPHNEEQPPPEMLEFYKIFKTISKGPLQTLISTTMPVGNLDKATNLGRTPREWSETRPWNTWIATWGCGISTGATMYLTMGRHMKTSVVNYMITRDG